MLGLSALLESLFGPWAALFVLLLRMWGIGM